MSSKKITIGDLLPDERSPKEKKEHAVFIRKLRLILKDFSTKDQQIIQMRFGLTGQGGHTLTKVSSKFKITKKYIREVEAQIFSKLNAI
jgi:RNA polymerase primary sigma factor